MFGPALLLTLAQVGTPAAGESGEHAVSLVLKLLTTLYVAVLIPVYWRHYGVANFLWFSDLALFLGVAALWLESSFLASMQAVSVGLLESVWLLDFLAGLVLGRSVIGLSAYMFKSENPLPIRALSLFHVWLPVLLIWLVWRLGYDTRAWLAQTAFAWLIMILCYCVTKPEENINWVFGPGERPQRRLPATVYLLLLLILFPVCVYLPTHLVLGWLFGERGVLTP